MYYTKGLTESIKSINQVVGLKNSIFDLQSKELITAYSQFLQKESVFAGYDFADKIIFTNLEGLKKTLLRFYNDKKKYFSKNSLLLEKRLSENYFAKALSTLKNKLPMLYDLSIFLIKVVLINHLTSYTNGTTDDTIGLSCIDFKDNFDENDFLELIIHQMTHMLLFIDDRATCHMIDHGAKEIMIETEFKYKLGGTKFPIYIAFHSYLVAIEVLSFRKELTGLDYVGKCHGDTMRIIKVCKKFQKNLLNHAQLFTDRGQSFLYDSNLLLNKII